MSTSQIIYKTTTKKFFDFKNIYKYTSYYQAFFDKISSFLIEISFYMQQSTKMYFQAIMLMNIETNYLALVLVIEKD